LKYPWRTFTVALSTLGLLTGCRDVNMPRGAEVSNAVGVVGIHAGSANIGLTREFLHSDMKNHIVDVTLKAGMKDQNTFNGHRNGSLTIAVPPKWRVRVHFENVSQQGYHSVMIVPLKSRQMTNPPLAFPGSAVTRPKDGLEPGAKVTFEFTASKAGQYAIMSGTEDQRKTAMWDTFVVSLEVPSPRIYTSVED
jgi:Sulfocyanin (SoxE) domain